MSDVNLDTAAGTSSDVSTTAPDFSASAPDTGSQSTPAAPAAPETDVSAGPDYDAIFGLEKEDGQPSNEPAPDVKATDPPAARPGDQTVENTPEGQQPDPAQTDKDAKDETAGKISASDKLDWQTSPQQFREAHEELKTAFLDLANNSLEGKFVNSPADFVQQLKETSPTSYNQVGAMLVEESAKTYPDKWIDHLLSENPEITLADGKKMSTLDYAAQAISGKEGMTADRLKAELAVLLEDDEDAVQAKLAEQQKTTAGEKPEAKTETPEQKAIREWREEKEATERKAVQTEVFAPIESAVDSLVTQAGLEIKEADVQGKQWNDLPDETKFKALVNWMIPVWIDHRVKMDPALVHMQGRLEEFLGAKDKASALKLQHPARIAAENFANEFLSLVTNARAKAKQSDEIPPANDNPPPVVRTAGASSANGNGIDMSKPLTADDWKP